MQDNIIIFTEITTIALDQLQHLMYPLPLPGRPHQAHCLCQIKLLSHHSLQLRAMKSKLYMMRLNMMLVK
jgi:hypothetical protein